MKKKAVMSSCGKYRYALWRVWDSKLPRVMFIGLNPSTADAVKDDSTIRRCTAYAQQWGYGGLSMGNLFAFRATKPTDLWRSKNPIGPRNRQWLKSLAAEADRIVVMWGNGGARMGRSAEVLKMIRKVHYLKMTKMNEPSHVLYLPRTLKPQPWRTIK